MKIKKSSLKDALTIAGAITLGSLTGCASPKYLTNNTNLGYGYRGNPETSLSLQIAESLEKGNYTLNGIPNRNLPESSFGYSTFTFRDKETGNELKIFVDREDVINNEGEIKPLHLRTLQGADIKPRDRFISDEEASKYWMNMAFDIIGRKDLLDRLNK